MLYSSLFVAVSAIASFAAAQNNTNLPPGVSPCCTVNSGLVNSTLKNEWCLAETNTCRELCGTVASGGNTCEQETLRFNCECRNGTKPDMSKYEQTVPGQMCRFWFRQCINATNQNLDQQDFCRSEQTAKCGTLLSNKASASSSGAGGASATTSGSGSADATSSSASPATSSPGAAAAIAIAREFGTPLFAGGIVALFGFAL